jgi:phosphatidylserine decarboxylase
LLDVCCWDKDRFGKDYLGEFDLALEEIFSNNKTEQEPRWFPLKSKRPGKKTGVVSGEVLLQFTLSDSTNREATPYQVLEKLASVANTLSSVPSRSPTTTTTPVLAPAMNTTGLSPTPPPLTRRDTGGTELDYDEEEDLDEDETPEEEDPTKPEAIEKKKRRLRIKGLKRKKRENPYEFVNGGSDVVGIIFLEICNITDLPPESNLTKTSFDMDPFVVASLGKKTYRTKTIRHKLNPVYNEKMVFQVQAHEQSYSFAFTVIDHDKYSGNDFIASVNLPLKELTDRAPKADATTGLYNLPDPPEYVPPIPKSKLSRLGMSRTSSTQSLGKLMRPSPSKNPSGATTVTNASLAPSTPGLSTTLSSGLTLSPQQSESAESPPQLPNSGALTPGENAVASAPQTAGETLTPEGDDPAFALFTLPLKMKNMEKWETKHNPQLYVRAKYMPYPALRQQFWRAMLKQYDTDESGRISKVELTTMLDTLGSTLRDSTIDSFFQRFPHRVEDDTWDLSVDEAVICLEDQLQAKSKAPQSVADKVKGMLPDADKVKDMLSAPGKALSGNTAGSDIADDNTQSTGNSTIVVPERGEAGEKGDTLEKEDLNDSSAEEHVVEIRECPICHQPRLNKRKDADIITHIATCASQDWRQVNNIVMGGFVTASQAQRKWYSKVISKVTYGGYKLGANSANILVQDRLTGQINEEKMSVYVRLGIRLLYKGLKSNNMENKRIRKLLKGLSVKQGKKYDDPASRSEIQKFIDFHRLDMSEVLRPVEEFKNFNEFFYRALKPEARPASAPDDPHIIVSPADCRSVVFNSVNTATKVWVKGREFSIKRLLGDAYPEDAKRYENGALGIFRLAPQDYHRFHVPVDGVMGKPKPIGGEYYTVNPMAIRSALDVYGENVRVIVPIDSVAHGRVMVICVGAMMVGSTIITRQEGEHVKKAEELGYFKFGGSTIVLLFEEGKMQFDDDLAENSKMALETLVGPLHIRLFPFTSIY